ncbi:M48 metallopeptidase family protein [Metabacillus flavus]
MFFNWLIFLAPVSMIEYVLANELTHLIHMYHSKYSGSRWPC